MAQKKRYYEKGIEAIYEGKIFRKLGRFAVDKWLEFWKMIDLFFGKIARYFMMRRIEIQPDKIIFIPFQGDYTCNLKYITEELLRQNIDCEIVWAVRKATLNTSYIYPSQIHFVEQYSLEYYREIASARIWVVNSVEFFKRKVYKKKGQVLIETWHGSLGIKRFDASVNEGRPWVRAARYCGKIADYCVSNSEFEDEVYRGTFWSHTPLLKVGHPRNDILIGKNKQAEEARKRADDILKIPENAKVALYAPTFRDNHQFDAYFLDYKRMRKALTNHFGGEWVVVTRFHPTVRKFVTARGNTLGAIDATTYDDIQELMIIADIGITDYSSWIYDFMLTRKPGFIFALDIEDYYTERGFYYPLTDTPFPVCLSNDDMEKAIMEFNTDEYIAEVEKFLNDKGCVEQGVASKEVVAKMKEIIGVWKKS